MSLIKKIRVGSTDYDIAADYNNLDNRPTIPSKVSQLTNDSGYLKASTIPSEYVKNTNYANSTTAGVVKVQNGTNGLLVKDNGILYPADSTYETYSAAANTYVISKGTLENVIKGKELTDETYVDNADDKINEKIDKLISILPKKTTTGTSELEYDNAKEFDILSASYKGNVEQDTTTGKNKFNIANDLTTMTIYANGSTLSKSKDKITFTTTNTENAGFYALLTSFKTYIDNFDYNKTYTLSCDLTTSASVQVKFGKETGATIKNNVSGTIRISNTFKLDTAIVLYLNGATGTTATISNIMIEENYSMTSYEPYTDGIASPNPDCPQEVKTVRGWNLVGLDTQQYKVDLKAGDKITACNTGTNQLTIQLFTNYGDTTRNDFWTINSGVTRTITVGYDTKALSWVTSPIGGIAYINKGDNLKPYLPYNCIGVKRTGKNLLKVKNGKTINFNGLDVSIDTTGIITINGTANGYYPTFLISGDGEIDTRNGTPTKTNNPTWYNSINIPQDTYTLKFEYISGDGGDSNRPFVWIFKEDGTNTEFMQGNTTKIKTYTGTINGVGFYVTDGTTYNNYKFRLQIEQGTTATPYEPYQEKISYIDLKGNEVLTTDEIKVKGNIVKLVKNWGKVVLDGSENLFGGQNGNHYTYSYKNNNIINDSSYANKIICYSTHFKSSTFNARGTNINNYVFLIENGINGQNSISINTVDITSLTEFKTWLSTNNVTFYYPLAAPQEITLDNVSIETLEGTNNVEILATLEPTSMSESYVYDLQKEIEEIKNSVISANV